MKRYMPMSVWRNITVVSPPSSEIASYSVWDPEYTYGHVQEDDSWNYATEKILAWFEALFEEEEGVTLDVSHEVEVKEATQDISHADVGVGRYEESSAYCEGWKHMTDEIQRDKVTRKVS